MPDEPAVGSPEWWLARLAKKLRDRARDVQTANDYYDGDQPLAFATAKFRQAFGDLFGALADNWCGLVVDAVEERLTPKGFRFPSSASEPAPEADKDAWAIWQANSLDHWSQVGHTESLIGSVSYVIVWADPDDPEAPPLITVESPLEVIVERQPGRPNRRAAGVKLWRDDWTGRAMATVYLPTGLYKFQSSTKRRDTLGTDSMAGVVWERREVAGEAWPLPNPLGVVPVVPLPNRERLLKPPTSELANVMPLQDAINKTVADMLVASEAAAMKRRWATGLDIPVDPETKRPVDDFFDATSKLWAVGDQDVKFGEFSETDLRNFIGVIENLVQSVASQSRTPPHYFYMRGQVPSGESIKAAETGLVAKVMRKMVPYGEAWEEVIRLAFAVKNDDRAKVTNSETIWADPESRSESEHVDSLVKKKAIAVPDEQLWEDAGYGPTQIERFKGMRERQKAFEPVIVPALAGAGAGAPGGNGAGG